MIAAKASPPPPPETPHPGRLWLLGSAFATTLGVCSAAGCGHDWNAYDPRLGSSSGAGASSSTSSTGATGGATTTSSSSGTGGATTGGTGGSTTTGGTGGSTTTGGTGGATTGGTGGATTSSSSTGGTGGGGGAPGPCGGTDTLAEDFEGGDTSFLWDTSNSNGAAVAVAGGELVFTLPDNQPASSWSGFYTNYAYDFRKNSISTEVTSAGNPSTTAWGAFGVGLDDNNYLEIYQEKGILHFDYEIDGVYTSLKTAPYDAGAHRYWQIRDDGLTTYWETSGDGTSWKTQAQAPTASLFALDLVGVQLSAGTDGGEMKPGEVHFDHLNGGGLPKGKLCPVHTITDDFDDGVRSSEWGHFYEQAPGMMTETAGQLLLTFVPEQAQYAGYYSSRLFDLTESAIVIELPEMPDPKTTSRTHIGLSGPDDNEIEMNEGHGQLELTISSANASMSYGTLLFSPVQHRWWRVREARGSLYWETAPDGKTWTVRAQVSPPPIAIDALQIHIGGGTYEALPAPGHTSFDNLNLPP